MAASAYQVGRKPHLYLCIYKQTILTKAMELQYFRANII